MKKNYQTISNLYKVGGISTIGLTTCGSFFLYESITNFEGLKATFENFTIVSKESLKLNPAIALPLIISIAIVLFVIIRKNKEALKGKTTLGLMIATCVFYLLYCIVNVAFITLIGAFVGSALNEAIFEPLSNNALKKVDENYQLELERKKEKKRIAVRKEMEALDGDGTV